MDGQSMADAAGQFVNDASTKLKEATDRAAAGAATVAQTASAIADRSRAVGAEAGARIKKAGEQSGEALRDVSKRGSEMARYLSETTAAHPIAAVLIAAAAGYAIARLTLH